MLLCDDNVIILIHYIKYIDIIEMTINEYEWKCHALKGCIQNIKNRYTNKNDLTVFLHQVASFHQTFQ